MPKKRLSMRKLQEILRLKFERGLSNRAIARSISVSPTSVSDCLLRSKMAGIAWPLDPEMDEVELEAKLYPGSPSSQGQQKAPPDFAHIHKERRRKGVTLQLLWQEYKQEHVEDGYQYSRFCEHYQRWRVEFQSSSQIAERYPQGPQRLEEGGTWATIAGQPTDDSEMALMLARSILKKDTYEEEHAAQAYARWYESRPFDIGGTTTTALSPAAAAMRTGQSTSEAARKSANKRSQANGALMRVSPLGIIGAVKPGATLEAWARADASLTHPHHICQEANVLFTFAVSFAVLTGKSPEDIYRAAVESAEDMGADAKLVQALKGSKHSPPDDYYTHQGWVLIALQNAFYQLLHADSLKAGVVDTVVRGGDTDTNAAIACALLGAAYGREAIPKQWLDRILTCRPMAGLEGVEKPRPLDFWPVDVLRLAELLLTARAETV